MHLEKLVHNKFFFKYSNYFFLKEGEVDIQDIHQLIMTVDIQTIHQDEDEVPEACPGPGRRAETDNII